MSSNISAATIDLMLRPSVRALRLVTALHVTAVVLLALADPRKWAGLGIASLFVLSWFWLRRNPAFGYGPTALSHLIRHPDGRWTVESVGGLRDEAELLGGSVVHEAFMVLNFRLKQGGRRTRVLTGDEADVEQLRRLRARLLVR